MESSASTRAAEVAAIACPGESPSVKLLVAPKSLPNPTLPAMNKAPFTRSLRLNSSNSSINQNQGEALVAEFEHMRVFGIQYWSTVTH